MTYQKKFQQGQLRTEKEGHKIAKRSTAQKEESQDNGALIIRVGVTQLNPVVCSH